MIKNSKGFSLIEVLVTVGLIGILVGIAIPSYNSYKQNTVAMALKADLGNGSKVYNAKYAVDSTYCHSFSEVGLSTDRSDNPIYKKSAFYGFEDVGGGDCASITATDIQYKSQDSGKCDDSNHSNKKDCVDDGDTWSTDKGADYDHAPADCELQSNQFLMGTTTNVSNYLGFLTVDEEGRIGTVTNTVRNEGNCTDPG